MMDALREGIGLRAYGQRDPVVEYQREAYRMFQDMVASIKDESLTLLLRLQPRGSEPAAEPAPPQPALDLGRARFIHQEAPSLREAMPPAGTVLPPSAQRPPPPGPRGTPVQQAGPKVGRNEPCPCGSGKKYKKCHGQ